MYPRTMASIAMLTLNPAAAQNLMIERLLREALFGGAALVDPPPGACSTPCPGRFVAMPARPAGA